MLLGNYNVIHKSPGKFLGGIGAVCHYNWAKNGQRMAIYTAESTPDQWSFPVGYGSNSWFIPRKSGYMVAFSENQLSSTGNAVMGVNVDGQIDITFTGLADLSLVVSATGQCTITVTGTGDAVGALYAVGSCNIDLSSIGTLGAIAFGNGISSITLNATADISALGHMTGTMSPFTELSPEGLAQAVWAYYERTLTGSSVSSLTPEQAEQLATAVKKSDIILSLGDISIFS